MSASPPDFTLDSLFSWLSWMWAVFVPTVAMILGTTVGTAAIVWIFSNLHRAMDAIGEIINRLSPRM